MDAIEAKQWVERNIKLRRRHTSACRTKWKLAPWDQSDKCRTCVYWSVGIHAPGEKFARRSTGETSHERAQELLAGRLQGEGRVVSPDRVAIGEAIQQFMAYTKDGGAKESTLAKYQTLMDQLKAYCDWKGYLSVQELNQEAVLAFRREWENERAGYKVGKSLKDRPRWRKMSIATCRRSAKTLRYFFQFAILRKWITENPAVILRFPRTSAAGARAILKLAFQSAVRYVDHRLGVSSKQTGADALRVLSPAR